MSGVALLVPRRADGGWRDQLWEWCRTRWEEIAPHAEIVEGFDDGLGLFCRSKAINDAAARTDADTLIVIDGDVWATREQLDLLAHVASTSDRFTVGYRRTVKLSGEGTRRVLNDWEQGWQMHLDAVCEGDVSMFVGVSRRVWDRVGGFDERFVGPGWQDVAFRLACEAICGPLVRLDGDIWHLWHPYPDSDPAVKAANFQRLGPYLAADGDEHAMRRVLR